MLSVGVISGLLLLAWKFPWEPIGKTELLGWWTNSEIHQIQL